MRLHGSRQALICALLCSAPVATPAALVPGGHVGDFTLLDQNGVPHRLYEMSGKKAIVIMTQSDGCPIVRLAIPALREIRSRYAQNGVEFWLLNPTLQDGPAAVAQEAADFKFDMPVLLDTKQQVASAWGVKRTAEVFVIDPKHWTLLYHGPIDDRLSYESQRPVQHRYLSDALDAALSAQSVPLAATASPGCLINFPNRKPRS